MEYITFNFHLLLGELGKPVQIDANLPEVKRAFSEFGFNTYVSDMVSMNRSLPDVRMEEYVLFIN